MGYRNIMISSECDIRIINQQLVINEDVYIPMEDINCILFENMGIKLSVYFLQDVAKRGILVYICNEKHIPNAVLLPLVKHHRHYKMLTLQINIKKPFQKRLWQQIVIRKIKNQAKCLEFMNIEEWNILENMAKEVQSGDASHVEAKAAAFYFKKLFDTRFTRSDEHIINSALNYGYAIIRGQIARTIICYGFEPSIGLFHHSELNAYNLADDMIEPFRPLVDLYVANKFDYAEVDSVLSSETKKELFNLLSMDMEVNGEKQILGNAIDKMIMSFSSCLNGNRNELWLPHLLKFQEHSYE